MNTDALIWHKKKAAKKSNREIEKWEETNKKQT